MAEITVPGDGRPDAAPGSESLVGVDSNAFFIMGHVQRELRRAGASKAFIDAYMTEAQSSDYHHLLAASIAYLDAESGLGE